MKRTLSAIVLAILLLTACAPANTSVSPTMTAIDVNPAFPTHRAETATAEAIPTVLGTPIPEVTATVPPCIGKDVSICVITPLTPLLDMVTTSRHWTDTTGKVDPKYLLELESESSGSYPIYGMFVFDGFDKAEASIELGTKYGLVYPSSLPFVTMVVQVNSDGTLSHHVCYNVWNEKLITFGKTEGAYAATWEDVTDNERGLLSWIEKINNFDPIVITLPTDVPDALSDIRQTEVQGTWAGTENEMIVLTQTQTGSEWSRQVVVVKGDEYPSWIELRWFKNGSLTFTAKLYPDNEYRVNGYPVIVEVCITCNSGKYAVHVGEKIQ